MIFRDSSAESAEGKTMRCSPALCPQLVSRAAPYFPFSCSVTSALSAFQLPFLSEEQPWVRGDFPIADFAHSNPGA